MSKCKYNPGDKIGPYDALMLEVTKTLSCGRYGLFLCPHCNKNTFEAKVYHVVNGSIHRCKECRKFQTSGVNNPNFQDLTGQKFGKLTVIKLLGSDAKKLLNREKSQKRSTWLCKCDCGGEKIATTDELKRHAVSSCNNCNLKSNGEYRIKTLLSELNIDYKCQYKFADCKDIFCLPFDFYLPDYNCCIEYDGVSHYEANPYGGWRTKESVQKTQEHDKIKNEYCQKDNIGLIRIPYWDYSKLSVQYLNNLLLKNSPLYLIHYLDTSNFQYLDNNFNSGIEIIPDSYKRIISI